MRNFFPASETCLYRSPFTWVKVSNSWCCALPFNSLLEMHLQKGSVLCICSNASRWSAVSDFGVGVASWERWGTVSVGRAEVEFEVLWVWLLVLKAGPSLKEAVSMLMDVVVGVTNLERQSAALFLDSRDPFKWDVVCGEFQTPSVYFVIGVLAIKELC